MKKLVGNLLIIAVGFAAVAFSKPIGNEIGKFFSSPRTVTESDIETIIEDSPAREMYNALQSYFPDDAEYFLDSMTVLLEENPSEEEAHAKMRTVGADIRRRHAANLRTAPDQSLSAILQFQTQIFASFDNDPVLCNRVIMYGPAAISVDQSHRVEVFGDSVGLLYQAMYEGEQFPVQRAQATADDWGNLIADFYAAGGTDDELDLVMQPDIQNPQLCGAMLRFLRVLTVADFPGSDRLRAEMVSAMNEH
jgi:hypothetical protein